MNEFYDVLLALFFSVLFCLVNKFFINIKKIFPPTHFLILIIIY